MITSRPCLDTEEAARLVLNRLEELDRRLTRKLDRDDPASTDIWWNNELRPKQEELTDLREAHYRILEGAYGRCEQCGQCIDSELLRFFPGRRLCHRHQTSELYAPSGTTVRPSETAATLDELLDAFRGAAAPPRTQIGVVDLPLPAGALGAMLALSRRGEFSCNHRGEIWAPTRKSLVPQSERRFVQGVVPLLDELVSVILAHRPAGGRFIVGSKGARMVSTGAVFAQFAR